MAIGRSFRLNSVWYASSLKCFLTFLASTVRYFPYPIHRMNHFSSDPCFSFIRARYLETETWMLGELFAIEVSGMLDPFNRVRKSMRSVYLLLHFISQHLYWHKHVITPKSLTLIQHHKVSFSLPTFFIVTQPLIVRNQDPIIYNLFASNLVNM